MKKILLAAILGVLVCPNPAFALTDYIFNCKNFWQQDLTITVPEDTVDAARKKLKTDREMSAKYSLDNTTQCVYRSERPSKVIPKARILEKKQEETSSDSPPQQ